MEKETLQYGFTTGSCATAATKAAVYELLLGRTKNTIEIMTPKGIPFVADIVPWGKGQQWVACGVQKDGGDDPDVTSGANIVATVSKRSEEGIEIVGGKGVGTVTKPGLDQPVGNAAINSVPRQMICEAVREVSELADYSGGILVEISVPEGETLAAKTFNSRLGIEGGISIIGTSGIVEPMSSQALKDTIYVELRQRRALGYDYVAVSPGNYGVDFMKNQYGYDLERSVKCSNFIGDTIEMAKELGFRGYLLTGHIGKLVKVSGGRMNTHSKYGDDRMKFLKQAAEAVQVPENICEELLFCVTTEDAIRKLREAGCQDIVMDQVMKNIMKHLRGQAGAEMEIECIMFSSEYGELARSEGVEQWLTLLVQEQEQ